MSLSGTPTIFNLDPFEQHQYQMHQLGARGVDQFGDLYRYAKVGGSNISKGKLQMAPAPKTNHHNVSVAAAAAIGVTKVTVTLGATAATANEYAGGVFAINDVDGEGATYRIKSHPAADSAGSLELTLERPIVVALTTSSQACLVHNAWNGVVEAAVEERQPAGVPSIDGTAGYFLWLKTKGVAAVLAGAAIDLGADVTPHASTAGAVGAVSDTAATEVDQVRVGQAIVAGVDTEYRPIRLSID